MGMFCNGVDSDIPPAFLGLPYSLPGPDFVQLGRSVSPIIQDVILPSDSYKLTQFGSCGDTKCDPWAVLLSQWGGLTSHREQVVGTLTFLNDNTEMLAPGGLNQEIVVLSSYIFHA